MTRHFFWVLSGVLVVCYIISGVRPFDRTVWVAEMASVFAVHGALVLTYGRFRFSNTGYFIVALWLLMHTIGAHYTFELVPFGFVSDWFGFERNHYDRVAHFVVGLNSYLFAEFFVRQKYAASVKVAAFFGVIAIMAMAAGWEVIEWLYAAWDGGDAGAAFLGSQGDVWDAQKDILADTLGAIMAAFGFVFIYKKNKI